MKPAEIFKVLKLKPDQVQGLYLYGSRVYGTAHAASDFDYLIIATGLAQVSYHRTHNHHDLNLFEAKHFNQLVADHHPLAWEILNLPAPYQLIPYPLKPQLHRAKIGPAFIAKAEKSWQQAANRLRVQPQDPEARAGLWHSLRLLQFGQQLLTQGAITDYQVANSWHRELVHAPHLDLSRWQNIFYELKRALTALA